MSATSVLTVDLRVVQVTIPTPGNVTVAEKELSDESERADLVGEDETDVTLDLYEPSKGGENAGRVKTFVEEEEPIPSNSFHPSVSDWVIHNAMEIKHCVEITCEGFEDEFMTLLTTIEVGYAQSKYDPSFNLAKKRERTQATYVGHEI